VPQTLPPLSPIAREIRGRIGDTVYSRNQYGPYQYTWTAPYDPCTPEQFQVRYNTQYIGYYWRLVAPGIREGWQVYADNVPLINRLGRKIYISAYNHWFRPMFFRWFIGLYPYIALPPKIFTQGLHHAPGLAQLPFLRLRVAFNPLDTWRYYTSAAFYIFASTPQSDAVNHFHGSFKRIGFCQGNPTSPPLFMTYRPHTNPTPAKPVLFIRTRALEVDNRVSPPVVQRILFTFT
jgi:hypothetical protein